MKNKLKKLVAAVVALAVAFTTVAVTDVTTAKAAEYETFYISSDWETLEAGVEQKYPFAPSSSEYCEFILYTTAKVDYKATIYNSAENVIEIPGGNPITISADSSLWYYDSETGYYAYADSAKLTPGNYTYGIEFNSPTQYQLFIAQEKGAAKISQTKAEITAGFTTKLSVSNSKVTKWSSSKKAVATVDSKGKVTGKKAGKTTISAKCENGQTVKCTVTVKANKYSASKLTTSDIPYGDSAMRVYSASYDKKGNLVIKACYVNNIAYKVSLLRNIKIKVKDANGKLVGTYSASKKSLSVPSHSTKNLTFTISKSKLKKKKVDLRNCNFECDGTSYYSYYY